MTPPADNTFFQGGVWLMLIGGLAAMLRNIPTKIWEFVKRKLWLECYIDGWDNAFFWVNQWLALRPEVQKANVLRVESRWYDDDHGSRSERRSTLTPGVGEHMITFDGARFWLSVTKEEPRASTSMELGGTEDAHKPYSLKIRCHRTQRTLLKKLLAEADALSSQPDPNRTRLYLPSYEHWGLRSVQRVRKADSVVLATGIAENLVTGLRKFEADKHRYEELGIPYRRGYLLHGPPGNGKSSIVLALAGILQRDLYILSLGQQELDDHRLITLMSAVPPRSIVLVEDVDTVFKGRERQAENKLTFSGVLNAIDGALASEGRILFVTANEPELLDAALVRPGRCDEHIELGNATQEQAARLFLRFFPGADVATVTEFGSWAGNGEYSMATLQGHLLKHYACRERAAEQPGVLGGRADQRGSRYVVRF